MVSPFKVIGRLGCYARVELLCDHKEITHMIIAGTLDRRIFESQPSNSYTRPALDVRSYQHSKIHSGQCDAVDKLVELWCKLEEAWIPGIQREKQLNLWLVTRSLESSRTQVIIGSLQ